jgi:DNA (cytosine-5)-methyltransferase 1
MLRAIREIQPGWIVGENVPGIINWSGGLVFHEVQTDLETAGYEVLPVILPAISVNAEHKRERIYFIAHNMRKQLQKYGQGYGNIVQRNGIRETPNNLCSNSLIEWSVKKRNIGELRNNYGLSEGLDSLTISEGRFTKESIKGYGNAIVPQVVHQIFKAIQQYEDSLNVEPKTE